MSVVFSLDRNLVTFMYLNCSK